MRKITVSGIEITHRRLVELTKLANQAKPFYEWIERQAQQSINNHDTLDENLRNASQIQIRQIVRASFYPAQTANLPFLFDGIGRPYKHTKACYYFFAWLIRDAPQQRLSAPVRKLARQESKNSVDAQIDILVTLIYEYRETVETFSWEAIREVIIDRLEGSRRSLKGHEKEVMVRTALLQAIQTYYQQNKTYGIYKSVEINSKQIKINNETYDVSANLYDANSHLARRILIPVKTRETQGGGHSHLFSRDLSSAISSASDDDILIIVIIAKSWSEREIESLRERIDHLVVFDMSPGAFEEFPGEEQKILNAFIARVLEGYTS